MPALKSFAWILIPITALLCFAPRADSQIVVQPKAGEEIILAVGDLQPKAAAQSQELSATLKTFNQVLWDDLKFAGFFTMAGKSFYPQLDGRVDDINYEAWKGLPFQVSFLSVGTLELVSGVLWAEMRLFDMKQRTFAFGKRIRGDADTVRHIAHRWADEVVYNLTAGASKGIASTKIAYTSRRGGAKEIYVMDYDGHDQRAFTQNGALNLFPMWAPDNSKLVFISNRTNKWEINLHSYLDGSRLPFPIFGTFISTPVISPDSASLAFTLSPSRGNSDIFIAKLDGSDRRNITNHNAIDTSPTWSPSGKQLAFVSDREGALQVYILDSDGANVRRLVKEGGDADSPAWSPDGKWLAFHWKPRHADNYDIYVAEVSTGRIQQLTTNRGSNESPSWAPDGRHLAFQSTRSGSPQIHLMMADGSEVRVVTTQGANTSPSWSGYVRN